MQGRHLQSSGLCLSREEVVHLPAKVPGSDLLIVRVVHQPVLQDRPPLGEEVVFQQADELLPAQGHS